MKAAKFMSKHELIIPELKVNKIIEEYVLSSTKKFKLNQ